MTMHPINFHLPTRVQFGFGVTGQVGQAAHSFGNPRVLMVTDAGIRKAGLLDRVLGHLEAAGVEVAAIYDGVEPNPSTETVEEVAQMARDLNIGLLVALGGGSPIDAAKMAGILSAHGGRVEEYEGLNKVPGPKLPVIAIPTTAGTGSEVTTFTVITSKARQFKMAISSPYAAPEVALVDPGLTMTVPAGLTAATGMDALTHAIESFVSRWSMPFTEVWALHAIRLIGNNLRQAVMDGSNAGARENLMLASTMAGACFTNTRLGNVHAMAHPLGGVFGIPHGIANAVLLPYVMKFNALACPDKFAQIAAALEEPVAGLPTREAAFRAVDAVIKLSRDIGIPLTLGEIGATEDAIPKMAEDTMRSGNVLANPRQTTIQDVVRLFEQAFAGDI